MRRPTRGARSRRVGRHLARRLASALVVLVVLAVVVACGGDDGSADDAADRTTTRRSPTTAERSTTTDRPTTTERSTTTRPSTTTTRPKATTTAPPKAPTTTRPSSGVPEAPAEHVRMPSGNIGCYLTSTEVRCDIAERSWEPPPAPPDCDLDWGHGLVLDARTTRFVCAGDSVLGAERVLEYGDNVKVGPFQCSSATTGVTCRDVRDGHGFSLARDGYDQF